MGGAIISELGGGIIPLQGRHYPGIGGGFLRNQQMPEDARQTVHIGLKPRLALPSRPAHFAASANQTNWHNTKALHSANPQNAVVAQ